VKYLKNIIRYYFYHLVKQKVFVSKHIILLEKEFVLEKSNGREIKLEKNKKTQIDIQMKPNYEVITLDV